MKRWLWIVACAAAWPASGCGGNVVVDGNGNGGGGGGGGGANTTTTLPPADVVGPACTEACELSIKCGGGTGGGPSCAEQCVQVVELAEKSGCVAETAGLYDCITETLAGDCNNPVDCNIPIQTYVDCYSDYCLANPDDCSGE